MSSKLNILESKKLFKEFNYLMSDIEFKNEFSRENGKLFELDIRKLLDDDPLFKQMCKEKFGLEPKEDEISAIKNYPPSDTPNGDISDIPNSTDVIVFTGNTIINEPLLKTDKNDPKIKHLYRKIVQKTHPDKVNSDALNELYYKAVDAQKNGDLLTMYSICNELGIKFNITDQEISMLRRQNEFIKIQQKNFEASHLWLWSHAENLDKKKEIVKHFLLHNAPVVAVLFS